MSDINWGERLKKAREAVGLTLGEAAQRLGFSNYQTLSNIEKGEREVKASELAAFARVYICDLSQLIAPDDVSLSGVGEEVRFLWREAPCGETKKRAEADIRYRIGNYTLLEKLLEEKQEGIGPAITITQENVRGAAQVDQLAMTMGKLLDAGSKPAFVLQEIMEQYLRIKILFVGMSNFGSAASTVHPDFGKAIVVNEDDVPWRINFTLAHELFHILTWEIFPPTILENDEKLFDDIEKKANRFASTLLIPEDSLNHELRARRKEGAISFADLVDVAREFGVSTQALLYRMVNIGLMKWEKAKELTENEELKIIGSQARRRDATCNPASSQRFILLAAKCLRRGLISRGKFAELVGINRADIDNFLQDHELSVSEGESIEIMAT